MRSDLDDVELYHQERLRNIEFRANIRVNAKVALSSIEQRQSNRAIEDKDFANSYASSHNERGYNR